MHIRSTLLSFLHFLEHAKKVTGEYQKEEGEKASWGEMKWHNTPVTGQQLLVTVVQGVH